jgi:FKBP-type peptidyl-prolyl cis-trans isomerase SlyD
MSIIATHRVVSLHYTLRNDAGDSIDSARGGDPLVYLHGADNIVPGLENRLEGCAVGEQLTVVVPPAEGYGVREGPGPQAVPRSALGDSDLEEGMAVSMEDEDGNEVPLGIVEIAGDEVFVDANHPSGRRDPALRGRDDGDPGRHRGGSVARPRSTTATITTTTEGTEAPRAMRGGAVFRLRA